MRIFYFFILISKIFIFLSDLDDFIDFMSEYQKKKNNGEHVELNENILSRWKNKIILAEKERERIKEKNEEKFDQIQKIEVNIFLNLINLNNIYDKIIKFFIENYQHLHQLFFDYVFHKLTKYSFL